MSEPVVASGVLSGLGIGYGFLVFIITCVVSTGLSFCCCFVRDKMKKLLFVALAIFLPVFIFLFFLLSPKLPLTLTQEELKKYTSSGRVDDFLYVRWFFAAVIIIAVFIFIPYYLKLIIFYPVYAKPLNPYKVKEE